MVRLVTIGLVLLLPSPAVATELTVAGTPARTEIETKLAYEGTQFSLGRLQQVLSRSLTEKLQTTTFQLPEVVGRQYRFETAFKPFVFRDIYFDTEDHKILHSAGAYRLRYRWSRADFYNLHRWFPSAKTFFPTRCEIQYKADYRLSKSQHGLLATETRFEFRQESEPFLSTGQSPPPAPWPEPEYRQMAQTGRFQDYHMIPHHKLTATIGPAQLLPQVEVTTRRARLHFNMKNPWGSGPNPDQVFIVSLDQVEANRKGEGFLPVSFVEIEVEIDRNILTQLERMAKLATDADEDRIGFAAQEFSQQTLKAALHDQDQLKSLIDATIRAEFGSKALPVQYKYRRIMAKTSGQKNQPSL